VDYYNLGNAYYELKRYDQAILYFNKSIDQDPSLLHAHHNLSLALIREGRGKEAYEVLTGLLEKDPDNIAVLQLLGYSLYVQGRGEEALEVYDKILEMDPNNLNAHYNRGIVLWDLGREKEVETVFRDLLESLTSEDTELYRDTLFNLGKLLLEGGDYGEAVVYLERYIEWRNDDVEAFELLARAYRSLESYDKALESYARILKLDDDLHDIWMDRAEILLTKIQDPLLGLEALNRALSLGFEDEKRIDNLLDDPGLVEKDRVEAILKHWGFSL
jgi:tetratricopeptide (TPR) repeat protein